MELKEVIWAKGQGSYYVEDLGGLRSYSGSEFGKWLAPSLTPELRALRETAETLSIGFVSKRGKVYWGDCVGVSYAGVAGREGPFRSDSCASWLSRQGRDQLLSLRFKTVQEGCQTFDSWGIPNAIRYGLSQALLFALAGERDEHPVNLICQEFGLLPCQTIPSLHGSCGAARTTNAEKMLAQRLPVLPHGQVDNIAEQFGANGKNFLQYVRWLVERLHDLREPSYKPQLHFDLHGALGITFAEDPVGQLSFLRALSDCANGLSIRLESPIVAKSRSEQWEALAQLRRLARSEALPITFYIDEWLTSVEDLPVIASNEAADGIHLKMPAWGTLSHSIRGVIRARELGLKVLLGGSCIETELSTRSSVMVALATQPDEFLIKPGMGIDEGFSLVTNEFSRAVAELRYLERAWHGRVHI